MADDVLNLAGRFHSTADDNKALDAIEVFDSTRDDKKQKYFNDDIVRLDEQINNTDGLKDRLEAVEDMASIQVDGGDVQIASTITPSTEGGKIPTVDAVKGHATAKSTFTTGESVDNIGIDSEPTAGSDNLIKSDGVSKYICSNKIVGANGTMKYWYYEGVTQNSIYRFYVNNPYWTVPQGLVNDYILTIGIRFSDGTPSERIVGIAAINANTRLNYYDIKIPTYTNNVVSGIYIGVRCADTDSVIFTVQNITDLTVSPYKYARNPYGVFANNTYKATSVRAFLNSGGYETLYLNESTHAETTITFGGDYGTHLVIDSDGHIVMRSNDAALLATDLLLLTWNNGEQSFVAGIFYPEYIKQISAQSLEERTEELSESIKNACNSTGFNHIALNEYETHTGSILSNGQWTSANNHIIIDVHNVKFVNVFCSTEQTGDYFAFLKTYNYELDALADVSQEYPTIGRFYVYSGNKESLIVPPDANYLYILNQKTSVEDMRPYLDIELSYAKGIAEELNDKIENREINNLIAQAKFNSTTPVNLNLLHFSDIHGDTVAAKLLKDFINAHPNDINDILCTGDVVFNFWNSDAQDRATVGDDASFGYKWWTEITELAKRCLFVLGNHDGATDATTQYDTFEGSAAWDGKGKDWDYATYFAPYSTDIDVTPPTGVNDSTSPNYHACYWHKDYPSQKIRVIGLDCIHRYDGLLDGNGDPIADSWVKHGTLEQEHWLKDRLDETLNVEGNTNSAKGYSVIIMNHYALDDFSGDNEEWDDTTHKFIYNQKSTGGRVINGKTSSATAFHYYPIVSFDAGVRFNMRNRVADPNAAYGYTKGTENYLGDIVNDYIENGGKFIVWLCGHTHYDYMWYPAKYPNILTAGIVKTGSVKENTTGDRSKENILGCNFYSIDSANGLFKIVRIGFSVDMLLISKVALCYDYINKKVINEI